VLRQTSLVRTIAFWVVAVALAIVAARSAASQVFRLPGISAWSVFSANDGDAVSRRFDQLFVARNGAVPDPARWFRDAVRVLRRNPLQPDVVRVAALASAGTGADLATVRTRMHLSERVSARDLAAQLWLLEDAVGQGKVPEVLQHYDRAMSVYPRSQAQLYPVLSGAIADRDIRVALAPYIRANRPWAYDFVGYAVDKAQDPAEVADLLLLSGGSRTVPKDRPLETMMLGKLVSDARVDVAVRYAQSMVPADKARTVMTDFRLSEATTDPDLRPFTWSTTEDLSIRSTFDRSEGLAVVAGGGIGGVAADRVMVLPPGKWRMTQKVSLPRLSPMMIATWTAACLTPEGPRVVWTQAIPQEPGDHLYQSVLDIPEHCRATRFRLTAQGADVQEDSTITIRSIALARM
jgi:hypothetical protein